MRALMLLGGFALLMVVLAVAWVDEGEVVTLATADHEGRYLSTELWVVDLEGEVYVRAATPEVAWLKRLRARPEARLTRGGETAAVRAVPVEDSRLREAVNRAMEEKYGRVERVLVRLRDPSKFVPVRLERLRAAPRL